MSFSEQGNGKPTIERLPDKILMNILSYLPHREIGRLARVCKKWRVVAYNSALWQSVSLRPEFSGLHVQTMESLMSLISVRFGASLRYIELPIELITHTVLQELASKCPNLTNMLLDFSSAMQMHDFNEMQAFPTKLKSMCICLSGVIFLEGFMRKIYNFINGLEVLHLIGTYDQVEAEEEEIYEVINIHKMKSATPNLRVVNMYGITFVDDTHVDALSSNCIQLECLSVNFCNKFTGSCLKTVLTRCKRLRCLLMHQTGLLSEHVMEVDWADTTLQEVDITATELSSDALIYMLTKLSQLRYLRAGQQDGFTDPVLKAFIEQGKPVNLVGLDLDRCDNISEGLLLNFMKLYGSQFRGLCLSGIPHLAEHFWLATIPLLKSCRILVMGMSEGCCQKIHQKIHMDGLLDCIANNIPGIERLEMRWDPDTCRYSDKSQKAVDAVRVRCLRLRCLVLSDGKYYELVKSNFERADRMTVTRTTTNCHVTLCYLLSYYKDLLFN